MKKSLPIQMMVVAMLLFVAQVFAANFKDLPKTISQPDGTAISCFASGDEFFNYLHDEDGYTIIQGQDGWYYYATKDMNEIIVPSVYKVGQTNPGSTALQKNVRLSKEQYLEKVETFMSPLRNPAKGGELYAKAPPTGSFLNPVVYIRFNDDPEFTVQRQDYIDLFTGTSEPTYSVQEYFWEVSYNQLTVNVDHYPDCAPTTNISFQDSHNRNYFEPYNATTNPGGYVDSDDRELREHTLLVAAINYVKSAIEADYTGAQLDMDSDGRVDNMTFIIYGDSGEWSELLWAHRWALYSQTIYINGKRVYDYNFQPEEQCSARTTCHELFHCMGSPDLYHYYDYTEVSPAYTWDLMESGNGSMTAYMKEQVGGWISIPEISANGSYELNPLASSTNNAFKIPLPNSSTEFLVVEFRKKTGPIESNLHSWTDEGLLIYRINTLVSMNEGNRNGPPDMLWVYRPDGDTYTEGDPSSATFSSTNGRTSFSSSSNPECHLSDDATWGGVNITNIGAVGTTITFDVTLTGYTVTFNVGDGTNPIAGALVSYCGLVKATNASGVSIFEGVQNGTSDYLVTKTGYDNATGSVTVAGGNAVKNVTMTMPVTEFDITFNVTDGTNPINAATVVCDGVSQETDVLGQTVFTGKENGIYNYNVTKTGYDNSSGTVTVSNGNAVKNVTLTATTYTITFNVNDGTDPINAATVVCDGVSQETNVSGQTVFTGKTNGIYNYSVNKAGYSESTGTVTVSGVNEIKEVTMTLLPPTYNVTFNVTDGTSPIEGADVIFNSLTQQTNALGTTIFSDVAIGNAQAYSVTYTGYANINGTVDVVNDDVVEGVVMTESVEGTKLRDDFCGASVYTTNTFIYCDGVLGAEEYEFKFVNTDDIYNQTISTNTVWGETYAYRNYVRLYYVPSIKYGLTYDVQVRAKVSGVWGEYGDICQFTLEGTKLKDAYCGVTYATTNTTIYADGISGTTNYEFKFVNTSTLDENTVTTESVWGVTYSYRNYLKLYSVPNILYGYTYDVQVRALVNGIWSEYGTVCQITLGGTKLKEAFCGQTISNPNTLIYCDGIYGTTNYEFRFTNVSTLEENTRTTVSVWGAAGYRNYMRLYYIPGLEYGATYDVDVRSYNNGGWSGYGQVCQLTYGPAAKGNNYLALDGVSMALPPEINAYPNPFSSSVTIDLQGNSALPYDMIVCDITGKVLTMEIVYSNNEYSVGEQFAEGVYFVIITDNINFKETLKIIKID